jgi:hypothetical protein
MRSVFFPYVLIPFVAPHLLILFSEGQANDSPAAQDVPSAAVAQQLKMRIINMDQKRGIATVVDRH